MAVVMTTPTVTMAEEEEALTPAAVPRVLQLLACDDVGGTESMVTAQVLHCNPSRVDYEVALLSSPGPVADRLRSRRIPVHSLDAASWLRKLHGLTRLLANGRFDVVNAYGFKATMLARLAVRWEALSGRRKPSLVCGVRGLHTTEVEDMNSPKARFVAFVEKWTQGAVDVWDANSAGAVTFLESLGIPASRIVCIPNGLDLEQWPPNATRVSCEPLRILCVSRFVPRKRHEDLLRALARLHEWGVAFAADFVGDGPTRAESEALAKAAGLDQQVRFHGTLGQRQIREVMSRANVFCLVSTWEGMPGAVMEAMASGLAVVATDVNGTDMLVSDGVTGRLVPPYAPEALACALAECLRDPDKTAEMGRAGRERIEHEFSLDVMVKRKEKLYADVVGRLA